VPWTRASELHRVLACPASAVLPRVPDAPGAAARWGTEVHAWKAVGGEPAPGEFGHLIKKRLLLLTGTPHGEELREEWWPSTGSHEATFSVRPDGSVIRPPSGLSPGELDAWKKSRPDDEWAGSADYVGDNLGRLWIDDLKTGRFPHDPGGPQFLGYGVGLGGTERTGLVDLSCTHWPKYPQGDPPGRSWAEVQPSALKAFQKRVERARRKVLQIRKQISNGITPDVNPGDHCQYCPCAPNCPANQEF
jgi:hypothetical protein